MVFRGLWEVSCTWTCSTCTRTSSSWDPSWTMTLPPSIKWRFSVQLYWSGDGSYIFCNLTSSGVASLSGDIYNIYVCSKTLFNDFEFVWFSNEPSWTHYPGVLDCRLVSTQNLTPTNSRSHIFLARASSLYKSLLCMLVS